jgi:hypothetical protein
VVCTRGLTASFASAYRRFTLRLQGSASWLQAQERQQRDKSRLKGGALKEHWRIPEKEKLP